MLEPDTILHLDVSLERARALHRVWRALNDGDCPNCHKHCPATAITRLVGGGIQCPACWFQVTGPEIEEIERLFAPAMNAALAIFNKWREDRRLERSSDVTNVQ